MRESHLTRHVKFPVSHIWIRKDRPIHRLLMILVITVRAMSSCLAADEVPIADARAVETRFTSTVSVAVQDPGSFDVFAIAPGERKIHRFTAMQFATGVSAPTASRQLEGEPQRVIVRSIGDSRFAFVQCANPMLLVQLDADSLNVVRQIPLTTSAVSDMFGSEAKDDPFVWLIIDGKPPASRVAIRQWKLVVINLRHAEPTVSTLQNCSAALVTADGKTLLTSASGQGVIRSSVSDPDKPSPTLTAQPEEPWLAGMRLRPGSFFSPDHEAIIVAGQWIGSNAPDLAPATQPLTGFSPAISAPVISFLRSPPLAVCLAQRTLDDGTMEPRLQFVELPSCDVLSTLPAGEGVDLSRGGRDWRIFETPDKSGLLFVTNTFVRFLPVATLPEELKETLNAPPMMLQTRPDLTFRIGEERTFPMQATDPRTSVSLQTGPKGMTLDDGILRWRPGIDQQGDQIVRIEFAAGSVIKAVQVKARAEFNVRKLPGSYYRFAYSPILRLLAGAVMTPDRSLAIHLLREDERGEFAVSHSIPISWPVTDLALSSVDGKAGSLVVSVAGRGTLFVFDPLTGTKTFEISTPLSIVNTLTAASSPQRSLLVYGGSLRRSLPVETAGLLDLNSGKDLGLFCLEPGAEPMPPERIFVRAATTQLPNQRNANSHAAISSDGQSVHFLTHPFLSTEGQQYSEWAIPDDLSHDSIELTCLHRVDTPGLPAAVQDRRLRVGSIGFAAIRSRLIRFGQLSSVSSSSAEAQHFVTDRPFLILSHMPDPVPGPSGSGERDSIRFSVAALNSLQAVTPTFPLPLGPVVTPEGIPNTLFCTSDESTQMASFARGDSLVRIPYSALGIDDQSFDPAIVVTGPRKLQAGNDYAFALDVFPPTATVSIEKSPAGVQLEGKVLKWKVAADAGDQETVVMTVTDGEKSRTVESLFRVLPAVQVTISQTIPRYTFDRESGLIAGIDTTTGLIVVFDIGQFRAGHSIPQRTLKLDGRHEWVEFKRVEDRLSLIVVSDFSRRLRVVDPDSGDVQFDLTTKLPAGTREVLASPSPKSPLVVLKSGQSVANTESWQFLNVKTGEIHPLRHGQSIVAFSDDGNTLALHDAQRPGQLVIADIIHADLAGSPSLSNLRSTIPSNTDLSQSDSKVDFQFGREHQNGIVFSANREATGQSIRFEPLAFFESLPFYLSMFVDQPVNQNPQSGIAAPASFKLTAVSRNTLSPVGRQLSLQIPSATLSPHPSAGSPGFQVFLADKEKTVLVTSPQACFVLPIDALHLPDEVSLALRTSDAVFPVGSESTVDLRTVDDRATISIPSLPDGMTFEENKLKWTPRLADAGSHPMVVQIQAGDQNRSRTMTIHAALPSIELPFAIADMSVEPQGNEAFLRGELHRSADGTLQVSMCVVDLKNRAISTESTIAAEDFLLAMFEGPHVIIALEDQTGPRLVILDSSNLSEIANVPLEVVPGQLGLLRKSKTLLVTQDKQVLRCSLPDLKWQADDPSDAATNPSSLPPMLTPEGIRLGTLSINWAGNNQLWQVVDGRVIHAQQVTLQPELVALGSEPIGSFTSEELRIVRARASSTIFVHRSSEKRSPLQANIIRSVGRPNNPRISLRISTVANPAVKLFQPESGSVPDEPNAEAAVGSGSITIDLDARRSEVNLGTVGATDNLVLAACGQRLWIAEMDPDRLKFPAPPEQPMFVRQQSHFLLEGTDQTTLTHTIQGGSPKVRIATANRIAGIALDSTTGTVTVDHKAVAESLLEETIQSLQASGDFGAKQPPDSAAYIEQLSRHGKEVARQVVPAGKTLPDGIPVFVPIELILLNDGEPVDALGYSIAVMVPAETIRAGIDEWQQKAAAARRATGSPSSDEVEQLRQRVEKLEERLKQAEAILRRNGIGIPRP